MAQIKSPLALKKDGQLSPGKKTVQILKKSNIFKFHNPKQ